MGGRTWTDTVDGAMLEIGGQWVSPDQTALLALLDELGLETYSRYRDGESVYIGADGTPVRYTGDSFPGSATTAAEMDKLIGTARHPGRGNRPHRAVGPPQGARAGHHFVPPLAPPALRGRGSLQNIGLFIAGGMLTKPAHAFSALQAVLMAASAGSFTHLRMRTSSWTSG